MGAIRKRHSSQTKTKVAIEGDKGRKDTGRTECGVQCP